MPRSLGSKILKKSSVIASGNVSAFGDRFWVLVYYSGSKYQRAGFYYLSWTECLCGKYDFWIVNYKKKDVGKFLHKKGYEDEEIEELLKKYEKNKK